MKFSWGETVRSKSDAPPRFSVFGGVCGVRKVATLDEANAFDVPVGSSLYLVEAGDGSTIEVPELFLEVAEK